MDLIIEPLQESFMSVPFLFAACLLIEYITSKNVINKFLEYGKLGPVIGAIVGCVPQCGFSVIAARLYTWNYITSGTLLSVFVANSDDAISLLVIHPELWKTMMIIIVIKLVTGMVSGLALDFYHHKTDDDYEYLQIGDCECGCQENIFIPAIKHVIKIFSFIALTNIGITLLINFIGEDTFLTFLNTHRLFQPIVAGIVGFIPNCAGSVILTQFFISGGLTFGALITGLTTAAGVGTLALIEYSEDRKDAFKLLLATYIVALVVGYFITFLGF